MKHSIKEWFVATRYWSFVVSAMPVIVTFAFLCSRNMLPQGASCIINLVLALLGAVILHAAGNVMSDYFDFKRGVDNEDAFAVPNLVFHKFEPKEYLYFSLALFAIGCAIGIILVFRTGLELLIIGGIGVLLTASYSFLKFRALGDLDIFLIFSVLEIMGTSYVICGEAVTEALCLALPIGIITVAVLHANNTLDIESDGKAGIKTFAMTIGGSASSKLYIAYMILPFVFIVASVIAGFLTPWSLLCLLAAVPAFKNLKAAAEYPAKGIKAMMGLDQATAKVQLVFSGLLAIGLFVSALV